MNNKGIKYKLLPEEEQEEQLLQEVGNQRFVWNLFLEINKKKYKREKKFLFFYDMSRLLTILKRRKKYEFLNIGFRQSLILTLIDLDKSLKNCSKPGFGFPRFKKKNINNSFRTLSFSIGKGSIILPKMGRIKINKHQSLGGKPKNITISKEGRSWYCSVCVEFEPKKFKKTGSKVGLDLGTVRLATTSNNKYKKPFKVEELEKKLKTKQRELARRTRGGENWKKTKYTLGKIFRKIRNKRQDYLHKYSTYLVKSHDLIVVEDLRIKNMAKSAKGTMEKPGKNVKAKSGLNRSMLNQGWNILLSMLEYKCNWYGKKFIKVDPRYTSQTCSRCGHVKRTNRKSQSLFLCGKCKFRLNADQNASRVILQRGLVLV